MSHRIHRLGVTIALGGALVLPRPAAADSCVQRDMPNPVYAGDPLSPWNPSLMGSGSIGITATRPRSGNGSLEAATTGSLLDWAFFRMASEGAAWGLLDDLNCLSFEWWREAPGPDAPTEATWINQTPAFRILIRDGDSFSQLIWEGWYNEAGPTVNEAWNFANLTDQLFWRHYDGGLDYTYAECANKSFEGSGSLLTHTLGDWVETCYSPTAEVYGIMLGLGSSWPAEYRAFLDNVQLSFAPTGFVVEDNFELPDSAVPEPGTILLIGTGLSSLAGAGYFRRRRRK